MIKYQDMKRLIYTTLWALCFVSIQASANNVPIEVNIKIISPSAADVTLTYPTPFQESTFSVLPSRKTDPTGIYSTFDLISAKNSKGETREFNDYQDGNSDAIVYTKPTDTAIKVTYRLDNGLQSNNISLFRFPLFLSGGYSRDANITVEYPNSFTLLAYPNSQHSSGIPAGKVSTKVSAPERISDFYEYDMFVMVHKKSGAYTTKKVGDNFTLTSSSKNSVVATKLIKDVQTYAPKYKQLLGTPLPKRVAIVVTPVKYKANQYEVEALQLSNNIVLLDTGMFDKNMTDLFRKKVLIHELAHVAMGNAELFRKEPYYARWFDEGLATFLEQYISDNYLHKGMSAKKIWKDSFGYQKMTPEEAVQEFRNYFDTGVIISNSKQDVSTTYKHAGLVFYNLHLKNKDTIPNLLNTLKGVSSGGSCEMCDTDNILQLITTSTGLSKDDIFYPYDKQLQDNINFGYTDPTASKLFLID